MYGMWLPRTGTHGGGARARPTLPENLRDSVHAPMQLLVYAGPPTARVVPPRRRVAQRVQVDAVEVREPRVRVWHDALARVDLVEQRPALAALERAEAALRGRGETL